jgi:hypothetical protein
MGPEAIPRATARAARSGMLPRMRCLVVLVMVIDVIGLAGAGAHADPGARADLRQAREALVERTRDYTASLERLLELQEDAARRATDVARQRRDQLADGTVSRREVEASLRQRDEAQARVEDTRRRLVEAEMVMAETRAAIDLAALPPPKEDEVVSTPTVMRYGGGSDPVLPALGLLQGFFASRFGRALPVSALGQTPTHDRLGLDHRHAVDVAVYPDTEEGRALMAFLRERHIPFLAFRDAVPGASTGAHLHIGSPSDRVLPVGWSPPR